MLKAQLLLLICILSSCIGYSKGEIKGELRNRYLDRKSDLSFKFEEIGDARRRKDAQFVLTCNGNTYPVELKYSIQESSPSSIIIPNLSILTLGLVPLYSTNNVNFEIIVRNHGEILVDEKVDSRAHFYYGFIPLWFFDSTKDDMRCHDGETKTSCLYRVAQTLAPQRLHRVLRENGQLGKICSRS